MYTKKRIQCHRLETDFNQFCWNIGISFAGNAKSSNWKQLISFIRNCFGRLPNSNGSETVNGFRGGTSRGFFNESLIIDNGLHIAVIYIQSDTQYHLLQKILYARLQQQQQKSSKQKISKKWSNNRVGHTTIQFQLVQISKIYVTVSRKMFTFYGAFILTNWSKLIVDIS